MGVSQSQCTGGRKSETLYQRIATSASSASSSDRSAIAIDTNRLGAASTPAPSARSYSTEAAADERSHRGNRDIPVARGSSGFCARFGWCCGARRRLVPQRRGVVSNPTYHPTPEVTPAATPRVSTEIRV